MVKWILHENTSNINSLISPPPPPPPQLSEETNLENKISPSILLIIVILAVIFFVSGLLHLLIRYLLRPAATIREPDHSDNLTALQGQLQQLFHLHDCGVDQSDIDALPVFLYKAVMGLKDPFDCAVCLCEFEPNDMLRLLPKCSHAFHIECIDTWLLSHSTCPLCRSSLVPEFSPSNICSSPVTLVVESGSESSRELGTESSSRGDYDASAHMGGFLQEDDFGPPVAENSQKLGEVDVSETRVVQVKLGKFRNVDAGADAAGGEGSSSTNLDQRRCFSMGSYEDVMNGTSLLQVTIKPAPKKKPTRLDKPGHARSECDCYSRREGFKGFDNSKSLGCGSARISSSSSTQNRESFSVSKIWLRAKKDKPAASEGSSRRAFSFRLPLHHESSAAAAKAKASVSPRTVSEFDADFDVEVGSCNNSMVSFGSQLEEAPSFARRTLSWIVGRLGSHNLS